MLHYLACATIAYFLARYLNTRFPGRITAVWSGGVAAIVGMVVGSGLVLGGMSAMGSAPDPVATIDRVLIQGFIWSAAGAAAGIFHGRRKAAAAEPGEVTAIPAVAWFLMGALSIAAVFGGVSVTGEKPSPTAQTQVPAQQAGTLDRDGQPCTQITEFLGECKRQP